ncbi:monovalent cation:proton antiporter family protein [Paenibacillus sp. IB182496]|uniref:Monovalent cation:proton antiporter family protein n=2 Tax=Paenibacillus sabuli TaxID=2772509 RepID=A0A927BQT9_9BACL|nr:monovalent cation:proton antiporter family protein [Paenibacillus sabuli]
MIVVIVAFLIPIVLHHFKIRALPVVVAEIIAGLALGHSGFNLITEDSWLELLSLFGFIYLMFLSGLEIDFQAFTKKSGGKNNAPKPLTVSLLLFAGILALSYVLSLGLVQMHLAEDPYLMTIIIATISLGVVVPVLKEKKLLDTELGQTLLLVTVISDFVTMILLAVYTSIQSHSLSRMLLLLLFFVVVAVIYLLIKRFAVPNMIRLFNQGTTVQLGMRAAFALMLLFVVMSEGLGVENILGAFLAGAIVSLLGPSKTFVHQLDSFGYGFLIPIFFVMIGVRMELWSLLSDWKTLLFIPVLLGFIFLSKMLPVLLLSRWYARSQVLGSGLLLSSTLSLVIAAASIALELGLIDDSIYGSLILVAVISCVVFPVLFNKVFPKLERKPTTIGIVGANHTTLPIVNDLKQHGYDVRLYTASRPREEEDKPLLTGDTLQLVASLDTQVLDEEGLFESDIVVLGTAEDATNISLAHEALSRGRERIVVRAEDPAKYERLHHEGFTVFSTLHASRTLLRALIEQPSMVKLFTHDNDSTGEIVLGNGSYDHVLLRDLPMLQNVLILRIYRSDSYLIPHGNTNLLMGDKLLVSGRPEHIVQLRAELE